MVIVADEVQYLFVLVNTDATYTEIVDFITNYYGYSQASILVKVESKDKTTGIETETITTLEGLNSLTNVTIKSITYQVVIVTSYSGDITIEIATIVMPANE